MQTATLARAAFKAPATALRPVNRKVVSVRAASSASSNGGASTSGAAPHKRRGLLGLSAAVLAALAVPTPGM